MIDPRPEIEAAAIEELGLRRITSDDLTITRIVEGDGVRFIDTRRSQRSTAFTKSASRHWPFPRRGRTSASRADRQAHLQAIGRDDAGRLQYIYHSAWEDVRACRRPIAWSNSARPCRVCGPAIMRRLGHGLSRTSLAAAARLVDLAYLRAGHEATPAMKAGRGVATLLKRHVMIAGDEIKLCFRGKGGKRIEKTVGDKALAQVLARLKDVPGSGSSSSMGTASTGR